MTTKAGVLYRVSILFRDRVAALDLWSAQSNKQDVAGHAIEVVRGGPLDPLTLKCTECSARICIPDLELGEEESLGELLWGCRCGGNEFQIVEDANTENEP